MLKKAPYKRKIRSAVTFISGFLLIFLGSFFCFFAFYFLFFLKRNQVISPVSRMNHAAEITAIQEEKQQKTKDLLTKYGISFTGISFHSESFIITLKDGEEITFSAKKDIKQQITSLQLIMKHFTIEGKLFKRIDFRFENPVVTF